MLKEIKTTLNQEVDLPAAPFPSGLEALFARSKSKVGQVVRSQSAGQAVFWPATKKRIDDAPAFNLRFNDEGQFIVYDVPPGIYGLQGRVDKEINGVTYAFEVFGQISVNSQFDEVALDPIPVLVTPMLVSGKTAPKISVSTHDGKKKLSLNNLQKSKGKPSPKYVFVNFWSTKDFVGDGKTDYQAMVQKTISELNGSGYKVGLLSICMDEDRKAAVKQIMKRKLKVGLHGFTEGWEHSTVNRYGVRSTPSGWLIDPDGKIAMSQYEFYNLTKVKESLASVIKDRIDGKDSPTPANSDSAKAEKPATK